MANTNGKTAVEAAAATARTFVGKWPSRFGNPLKHIEVGLDVQVNDHVTIPNPKGDKPYGPYLVLYVTAPGEAAITKDAFCIADGASTTRSKPLTKQELEQQNAQLLARLAALEAKTATTTP